MLKCDLHTHTMKSRCGYATPVELLEQAARQKLDAIGVTDHDMFTGGYISHALFRIPPEYKGVRIFKGVELTIFDDTGKIGLPFKYLHLFDIILAGFHIKLPECNDPSRNAEYLLNFVTAHPYIDVITHPVIDTFPLDFERVVPPLAQMGVALEINNEKLRQKKSDRKKLEEMVGLVKDNNGRLVINSDAHTTFELGADNEIRDFLDSLDPLPDELIINDSYEKTCLFIEERRKIKLSHAPNKD